MQSSLPQNTMLTFSLSYPVAVTRVLQCGASGGLRRGGCWGKALLGSLVSTAGVIDTSMVMFALSVCSVTVDFIHILRVGGVV